MSAWDRRFRWLPRIGWTDLAPDEASDLGLEQVARWRWEAFGIEWLGHGIFLAVRARIRL